MNLLNCITADCRYLNLIFINIEQSINAINQNIYKYTNFTNVIYQNIIYNMELVEIIC